MKTRKLVFTAIFIACSFIGANLRIAGTIAFDSMPAFLGAVILGPLYGGIIAAFGHFLTALTLGFPLSIPVHTITMFSMGLTVYLYGKVGQILEARTNKWIARLVSIVIAILFNGPVALLLVTPIAGLSVWAMLPILCIVAAANVLLSEVIYGCLPAVVKKQYEGLKQ
jgi:uncharacterized membrane protein